MMISGAGQVGERPSLSPCFSMGQQPDPLLLLIPPDIHSPSRKYAPDDWFSSVTIADRLLR